jgi:acyl-coenzyme A thioesterase PaaI-like protein
MDALFELAGESLVPTDLARGPWDVGALHGGPVAGIVTRAVERHLATGPAAPDSNGWQLARLTLELLRPVPVEPLDLVARTSRPGRKVTLVEVSVTAAGREVARAVALAIRRAPLELPPLPSRHAVPTVDPAALPHTSPPRRAGGWRAFHNQAVDMRWETGTWEEPGPVRLWMRLRVPFVAGEATTPAMRATSLADFANGVSSELPFGEWRFLNAELTVHMARQPVGEWVCLDARTLLGPDGAGMAESELADSAGVFGRGAQALLIERM